MLISQSCLLKYMSDCDNISIPETIWGYSSAGRALEWHSRGQRFDPAYLHQKRKVVSNRLLNL